MTLLVKIQIITSKCEHNINNNFRWKSAWVFSCKFPAYFQNTFSQEHLSRAAFGATYIKALMLSWNLMNDQMNSDGYRILRGESNVVLNKMKYGILQIAKIQRLRKNQIKRKGRYICHTAIPISFVHELFLLTINTFTADLIIKDVAIYLPEKREIHFWIYLKKFSRHNAKALKKLDYSYNIILRINAVNHEYWLFLT